MRSQRVSKHKRLAANRNHNAVTRLHGGHGFVRRTEPTALPCDGNCELGVVERV